MSSGEDYQFIQRVKDKLPDVKKTLPYIYRWATNHPHVSGFGIVRNEADEVRIAASFKDAVDKSVSRVGVIELQPRWDLDYEKLAEHAELAQRPGSTSVAITTNWCSDAKILKEFARCSPGRSTSYGVIKLTRDVKKADFIVTINSIKHGLDLNKAIAFTAEPSTTRASWGDRCPTKLQVKLDLSCDKYRNFDKWYINLDYNQLTEASRFVKTKFISAVISGLGQLPGHRDRLEFLSLLKQHVSVLDHFGRNHPGAQSELDNKEDGLVGYMYTFNCENSREPNYFTEKIVDAILCECLCFYDGCPNIEKFIDPEAYIKIDTSKPREALWIVLGAMQAGEWARRLPAIRRAKHKLMHEENPLSVICEAVKQAKTIDLADYKLE